MNREEQFVRYVKETRDCAAGQIDAAMRKGIDRAKNDKLSPSKLFRLAAACAATAALCFALYAMPLAEVTGTRPDNGFMTRENVEALSEYTRTLADTVIRYLGG